MKTLSTPSINIMIVDDSSFIRTFLQRMLQHVPHFIIEATAENGMEAIKKLSSHKIDVMLLDIEMPKMDGLTALPHIVSASPHTKIIMVSTLTKRNAEITIKALTMGAADYLEKPSSMRDTSNEIEVFKHDLITKVTELAASKYKPTISQELTPPARNIKPEHYPLPALLPQETIIPSTVSVSSTIKLRSIPVHFTPKAIAIGSSTGGPEALTTFFNHLKKKWPEHLPIFITQHMPPFFTTHLSEQLEKESGKRFIEAKSGDLVEAGTVYLAPGDYHMGVEKKENNTYIILNQEARVNFCRPAVDVMLDSLVNRYKGNLLTIILTGMGQDGLNSSKQVVDKGGVVIAQDEKSSVVWGMPRAVAINGLCSKVLPLDELAAFTAALCGGKS